MARAAEPPLLFVPAPVARLTSDVVFVWRLRTKASGVVSVSAGSRFGALLPHATCVPSADRDGNDEAPVPFAPAAPEARLTSVVVAVCVSRMYTCLFPSVSGVRPGPMASKTTYRPSADTVPWLAVRALAPFTPLA